MGILLVSVVLQSNEAFEQIMLISNMFCEEHSEHFQYIERGHKAHGKLCTIVHDPVSDIVIHEQFRLNSDAYLFIPDTASTLSPRVQLACLVDKWLGTSGTHPSGDSSIT